jgi:putative membrane protein
MTAIDWLIPWEFSVTFLVVFLFCASLYCRGLMRSGHGVPPATPIQKTCFWTGMLLVYIVTQTGFDFYAEHEFFIHRLQHLVQHHLGPFLIVLGVPPATYRRAGLWLQDRRTRSGSVMSATLDALCIAAHPVTSALLFNLLVLFWLIPAVHLAGMLDWRYYRIMNFGMLANGMLFWAAVLRGAAPLQPAGSSLSPVRRVVLMVAVVPLQIVLGAVIFMTPTELYPVYSMCGRAFGGITALEDQQIGGLILWVPGAMMSVAGILLVLRERFTGAQPVPA